MRLNQPLGGKGSRRVFVSDTIYTIDTDGELTPKPDFFIMNTKTIDKLRADLAQAQNDKTLVEDILAGATDARRRAWANGFLTASVLAAVILAVYWAFQQGVF